VQAKQENPPAAAHPRRSRVDAGNAATGNRA
jgi:hypothetical protein